MFSIMKKRVWYDWILVAIRTLWLVIIASAGFVDPSLTVVSLWVVLSLAFVVYLVPLIILYRKEDWYLTIEVTVTGFFIFI